MVSVTYENPDLKKERANCSFNKEEITHLIDGGREKTEERKELGKCLDTFEDSDGTLCLSHVM